MSTNGNANGLQSLPNIVVAYDPIKGVLVSCQNGIADNEMLALYVLEKAKDVVKAYAAQKSQSGIVGATALPPNLRM